MRVSLHTFLRIFASRSFGRRAGRCCFAAAALLGAAVELRAQETARAPRTLVVSAATDDYPYSYIDAEGELKGYAVDLLDAVADTMHVTLRRVPIPSADGRGIDRLLSGEYDLGQFHVPVPGGGDGVAYSQPILVNGGEIFVRRGDRRIAAVEDLSRVRARIATPQQGRDYLVARGIDPAAIVGGTAAQCLTALSRGEVDAVVLTRLTGLAQAHHLGLRNIQAAGAELTGLKVSFSIAMRKDDPELLAQVNEALATLSITGRTEEIYSRWFGRFHARALSVLDITAFVAASLGLALVVALWALWHQRALRRQIAGQAAQLRESQEILAAAQRFAHLGHWHRTTGPNPHVEWSAETYRIFERDPSLPPYNAEEVIAVALEADRERWYAAIRAGTDHAQPYDLDVTIVPRPGVTKVVHVNARPVFDRNGRQTGVFGTLQDITAPRAAESALRRSEQLLRALYDNLPFGLGVVEQTGGGWQIVSVNPAALQHFGLPDPAEGCPLNASALRPEWLEHWSQLLADCAKADRLTRRELLRGDLRRVFTTVAIPLDPVEGRARVCFVIEDITDRRRQEAEIAQGRRLRAIGELVGGIAHEFNNLLTPIRLGTELIQADWQHDAALCAHLKLIGQAAARSAQLVQRLLTFGRQSDSQPETFDLDTVVANNIELLRPTIDRRIAIESRVPADLPQLYLPVGAVHQVLVNLLLNARDTLMEKLGDPRFSGWTPRVWIEAAGVPAPTLEPVVSVPAQRVESWIRLTVHDNGCGMSPETIERLFEPFYTTKQVGRGTGLGLATVWHLVAGFGGRIDVESTLGEGSALHVTLPVLTPRPAEAPAREVPVDRQPPAQGRHFLLVDDEQSIADLVATFMRRRGHQVTAMTHALEAWTLLSTAPATYDAAIIDLNMPGMNGVEFARRARGIPFRRPIIVLSGRVTDSDREALAAANVTAIIAKPFTLDEFECLVGTALNRAESTHPFGPAR